MRNIELIALSAMLFGCTKTKEIAPIDLLTGGKEKEWQLIDTKSAGKSDIGDCEKDDYIIINKLNSTLILNPNTIKCDPKEILELHKFKLTENDSHILVDEVDFLIEELSKENLILTNNEQGTKYEIILIAK